MIAVLLVTRLLVRLGATPAQALPAAQAWWESVKITGHAVLWALLVASYASGAWSSPAHLLAWARVNLWTLLVATVIAPAARGRNAYVAARAAGG